MFVLGNIASDFGTRIEDATYAISVTLATRPVGAFMFGWLADRYGRRPVLMADILLYSGLELPRRLRPISPRS
jgi:SHS family lactate transporter-like MFS transporter